MVYVSIFQEKLKGMGIYKKKDDERLSAPNYSSITYGFSPQHKCSIEIPTKGMNQPLKEMLQQSSHICEVPYPISGLKPCEVLLQISGGGVCTVSKASKEIWGALKAME